MIRQSTGQIKNQWWAIQAAKIPVVGKSIAKAIVAKDELVEKLLEEAKKQQSSSEHKG